MTMPSWASSLVRCFRDAAKIPANISDDRIYAVITENVLYDLYYSSSNEKDKEEILACLRQEVGLPVDPL